MDRGKDRVGYELNFNRHFYRYTPPRPLQVIDAELKQAEEKIVRLEDETVWLTQQHMAEMFQTTRQNISLHLKNIYDEGELEYLATHKEILSVRREGSRDVRRRLDFYNLDAIISVGYRVKSAIATRFRIWATTQLRELIVKGFILDDAHEASSVRDATRTIGPTRRAVIPCQRKLPAHGGDRRARRARPVDRTRH